jgi:hypothetical protein
LSARPPPPTTQPTVPAPDRRHRMSDTTYIVLRRISHPQDAPGEIERWEYCSVVEASSSDAAIRKGATAPPDDVFNTNVFVAVPHRSFKPVTVTTETKTVLKLEQPNTAA